MKATRSWHYESYGANMLVRERVLLFKNEFGQLFCVGSFQCQKSFDRAERTTKKIAVSDELNQDTPVLLAIHVNNIM